MEHPENSPKRQKIEESSAISFWTWYLPNSAHPKQGSHQLSKTFFRFDAAYRVYYNLVRRKWHSRWYMIEILKVSPYQMWTFETLRAKGCFTKVNRLPSVKREFWEDS